MVRRNQSFNPKTNSKICSTCRIRKGIDNFFKRLLNKSDGHGTVCKDCHAKYMAKYDQSAYRAKAASRHRKRFPERDMARAAVKKAIKLGKLSRPKECSKCRQHGEIEAHHPDYKKPLSVIWLCHRCHGKAHRC